MRSSQGQPTHRSEKSLCGRVFDIQRFSVHDGAGIRTTVFLKGCPLRCAWCQNPEGIAKERVVVYRASDCIGCGTCVRLSKHGGVVPDCGGVCINTDAPEDFDLLIDQCPANALQWNGRDMLVADVMKVVLRDRPFYAHGGGITLSGGDPLMQKDFAVELLRAAGSEGINTALETEMHAPYEVIEAVLPYVDTLYADIKLMNPEESSRYTGVDGRLIRNNVEHVLTGPHANKVIVRTPLVPGITATEENIRQAARFLYGLRPDVPYELLNYNPLAPAKYGLVGQTFMLGKLAPLDSSQLERLVLAAREEGLTRVYAGGASGPGEKSLGAAIFTLKQNATKGEAVLPSTAVSRGIFEHREHDWN